MKIKKGYMMREVAGNTVVVPFGEEVLDFNGIITLNETGRFLWELLSQEQTEQSLLGQMLDAYEIDERTAAQDIHLFLTKCKEADLFE